MKRAPAVVRFWSSYWSDLSVLQSCVSRSFSASLASGFALKSPPRGSAWLLQLVGDGAGMLERGTGALRWTSLFDGRSSCAVVRPVRLL